MVLGFLKHQRPSRRGHRHPHSALLVIAVVSLTSAIGYRFYNEPQLAVDKTAPETMEAPRDAVVEDTKTTEANREIARTGAVPVLMVDPAVNQQIYQAFQQLIDRGDSLREQAGQFPFIAPSNLSTATQRYLRQIPDWEWLAVLATSRSDRPNLPSTTPTPSAQSQRSLPALVGRHLADSIASSEARTGSSLSESSQQLAIVELQAYRRLHSPEDFRLLESAVNRSRQRYRTALTMLAGGALSDSDYTYSPIVLDLADEDWTTLKASMRITLERMLAQGIAPGTPDSLIQNGVRSQLEAEVPQGTETLALSILTRVLKPNLVQDPEQTRLRAEQAAKAVEPEIVEIREGEVIVSAGETITQSDFVLLDYFGMSRRRINWKALVAFSCLVTGSIVVFLVVERFFHTGMRRRDHILVLLLSLSTPLVAGFGLPSSSLPAVGLLMGGFYGSIVGGTVVGLLSIVLPIGMELSWTTWLPSAAGGLLAALLAGRLRSREESALLGLGVGLIQGTVYLIVSLIMSAAASPVWYVVLTAAAIQSFMGIAWVVTAIGLSPYLEQVFDLITSTRLVELANPNRPLLKRLASEAPGTFQHTLFVATLAEAAARTLGCNVELVRAGTLYHDIGKMHDALGFIENQMGGPNKHDLLDDPWQSAQIIKKHVTEGLVMARKCRLPKAIQAFIPEHQGTMLITYFYYQAQQRAKEDPTLVIQEADFRYDGPIPQSRETGIVMLADSCEAALRSLKDATPEEALAMVNRILRARWQDNQLVDSGLTRAEMTKIANIFVQVWQQFNHQRIPYPKAALNPQPSSAPVS
jgi:putative nucleotidyltransferase with HDIG domain